MLASGNTALDGCSDGCLVSTIQSKLLVFSLHLNVNLVMVGTKISLRRNFTNFEPVYAIIFKLI